jgi:hypothetical protein
LGSLENDNDHNRDTLHNQIASSDSRALCRDSYDHGRICVQISFSC